MRWWAPTHAQAKSALPNQSSGPLTPAGHANSADEVKRRYSMSASWLAIAFYIGTNCRRGSRTKAMKNSPASSPPTALLPSTKL